MELFIQQWQKKEKETPAHLVIACTLDTFTGSILPQLHAMFSTHLFLDEAGYASLVKALPLFAYHSPVTFLGDHMQLTPVCEWHTWESNPETRSMLLWSESAIHAAAYHAAPTLLAAYENYKSACYPPSKYAPRLASLTQTYRFSKNLTSILDAHIYRNGFCSAGTSDKIRITILDAPKHFEATRRTSSTEAGIIRKYLDEHRAKVGHYVIITPYRAQIELLSRLLPDERRQSRIMTVHKCQGQEWDTVFFSIVDTKDKWFTDSQNKLSKGSNLINTAVSRVKKHLIIVCDRSYWEKHPDQLIGAIIHKADE